MRSGKAYTRISTGNFIGTTEVTGYDRDRWLQLLQFKILPAVQKTQIA